jgi:BirA family biotin operon repressor/biotin-[acetyl-CoA-carboxylase] ligase
MLDGRKICGILIESPGGSAPAKGRLIIGIGINVNNSMHDAPADAGPIGVALADVTHEQHDLQNLLIQLIEAIEHRLSQLESGDAKLPSAWQQLCLLKGRSVRVKTGVRTTEGKCLGMAIDGALIVESSKGRQSIYNGTIDVLM